MKRLLAAALIALLALALASCGKTPDPSKDIVLTEADAQEIFAQYPDEAAVIEEELGIELGGRLMADVYTEIRSLGITLMSDDAYDFSGLITDIIERSHASGFGAPYYGD